jgi:ferredoxin
MMPEIAPPDAVEFSVRLDGVETKVPYLPGTTLLDSMLACPALKDVPHSCRQGHCGTCMGLLVTGEVNMLCNLTLSKRDLAAGYVLACQSIPLTKEILLSYDD